jgi:hypothetical protein
MNKFERESPGLYSRVKNHVRTCFSLGGADPDYAEVDFAELCTFFEYVELSEYGGGERWSRGGSRENLAFEYYLGKTIAQLTPQRGSVPDIYLKFAEQLHELDQVLVFNWD